MIQESDEIRKAAYLDDLTGLPNRFSCDLIFQMYADPSSIKNIGCASIVISNLVTINESVGRDSGNQVIADFCQILEDIGKDLGFVGRNGGNEFLFIVEDCNRSKMEEFFQSLNKRLKRYNALDLNDKIEIYYKYVLNNEYHAERFSDLITEVYQRLHTSPRNKQYQ
ncbi:MAG: GGDEF domain-containing protein [Lachnospiraceae bacterium]|nr:GGDEF domain-containing protein [Lachnospiraceae bacterium]